MEMSLSEKIALWDRMIERGVECERGLDSMMDIVQRRETPEGEADDEDQEDDDDIPDLIVYRKIVLGARPSRPLLRPCRGSAYWSPPSWTLCGKSARNCLNVFR